MKLRYSLEDSTELMYYTDKSVLFTIEGSAREISEPRREGNLPKLDRKSLKTCSVLMPAIVPIFIAVGQTMYDKSVTKTH